MKMIIFLLMMVFTVSAFSKEMRDFNHLLIQKVQEDIKNENDQKFRVDKPMGRSPASVEAADEEGTQIQDTQKIEKTNFRQIGPNKW